MKRLKNLASAIFFSPEMLLIVTVLIFWWWWRDPLVYLGRELPIDSEIWKYWPTAVFGLAGLSVFGYSSKIRAPLESSSNKALYGWPNYRLLVDRVHVAILFNVGYCGIAASVWALGKSWPRELVGALFVIAVVGALITVLTMLFAHQRLRELLEKFST